MIDNLASDEPTNILDAVYVKRYKAPTCTCSLILGFIDFIRRRRHCQTPRKGLEHPDVSRRPRLDGYTWLAACGYVTPVMIGEEYVSAQHAASFLQFVWPPDSCQHLVVIQLVVQVLDQGTKIKYRLNFDGQPPVAEQRPHGRATGALNWRCLESARNLEA